MRLEKEVKIERQGKGPILVKVFEVRPRDLLELLPKDGADDSLLATIDKALPLCSDIQMAQFTELYPSEQETLIDAFKEVNRPFLTMAAQMGMGPVIEELRRSLVNDLQRSVINSLPPAISTASTTAGAGSSVP
jgi:hypothetical protein